MAEKTEKNHSRRKFLSLGLLAGAGIITNVASASPLSLDEKVETVKMLTQDGKVVEIEKSLVKKAPEIKQASKKDVLTWIHPEK